MAKRTCSKPSRSKENQVPSKRFHFDMEDDNFQELSKGFVLPNTVADMRKCVRLFQDWAKDRNARFPEDKAPNDLLLTDDLQNLSWWLCKFCTEICKVDGTLSPMYHPALPSWYPAPHQSLQGESHQPFH